MLSLNEYLKNFIIIYLGSLLFNRFDGDRILVKKI